MVVRKEKRKRKYFGTRRWGVGNIKNARGHGSKGGAGMAGSGLGTGSKHKFTYITAKHPELIRKVGFTPWNKDRKTGGTGRYAQGDRAAPFQKRRRKNRRAFKIQSAKQRYAEFEGDHKGSGLFQGGERENKGHRRRGNSCISITVAVYS